MSSTLPVKMLISLMKLLNLLTCNPVKPGKEFKTSLNDIFYYHPCEYFPLIFKCIMYELYKCEKFFERLHLKSLKKKCR